MATLVFVLPRESDQISGGHLYNGLLLTALRAHTEVDAADESVLLGGESSLAPGTYLVDSLNLGDAEVLLCSRPAGCFFVLLAHSLPSLDAQLSQQSPAVVQERRILPFFDAYLATGAFTASYLRECGLGERVVLFEPPPPVHVPPTRMLGQESLRALMVCNLVVGKGVFPLLEALDSLLARRDNAPSSGFHLDIIGGTAMEASYAAKCASLVDSSSSLRPCVRLLGEVAHEKIASHYQEANLFVSASTMETFGMALQEARHHGLPLYLVRGGNAEAHLVAEKTGASFANPRSLASGLLTILRCRAEHERIFHEAQARRPKSSENWYLGAKRLLATLAGWGAPGL